MCTEYLSVHAHSSHSLLLTRWLLWCTASIPGFAFLPSYPEAAPREPTASESLQSSTSVEIAR